MKLVLQIAAGVLLAAAIAAGLFLFPLAHSKKEAGSFWDKVEIDCTVDYTHAEMRERQRAACN
ncbi:hypothetical protein MAL1_00166 [Bacteriophage DSS3_MAL1]|nr:hypothetical protein MAL1_00166 [Bacteriophage DSS3_MAL1]